ncbi:hypothetical protein [Sneathiella sp.]|jgi:TPR repeat protein|uniref:tetratricopeptide repeat protein n=1 Tax=Sneathiella sp. TaxID=1964365 RepID=UPI0039E3B173
MRKLEKILTGTAVAVVLSLSIAPVVTAGFEEAVAAYEQGDYKTAYDNWLPLAEDDDPAAMRNIGHLFRRGLGVEKDFSLALKWYKRAANMGFDRAQANVGTMYLNGEGVDQNFTEAASWFTKAARNGHTIAQYNLGLMYEYGKGVEKNKAKALAWYNLASKAGHKQALNKLSILVAGNPDISATEKEIPVKKSIPVATVQEKPKSVAAVKASSQPETPVVAPTPKPPKDSVVKTVVPATPKPALKPVLNTVTKPVTVSKTAPVAPVSKPDSVASVTKTATASSVTAPEKPAPTVKAETKFDPFAGSENKVQTSGEATVFSKAAPSESPKTVAVPIADKPKEEKGFFAALKSLVSGDSEQEKAVDTSEVKTEGSDRTVTSNKSAATTDASPVQSTASTATQASEKVQPQTETAQTVAAVAPQQPVVQPKMAAPAVTVAPSALSLSEQLELAELAFTLEEYQQALSVWAPLAQKGNDVAQYRLGVMFNRGLAVPVDRVRAYYWWEKAKQSGNQNAAQSLANLEKTLTFLEKRQLQRVN